MRAIEKEVPSDSSKCSHVKLLGYSARVLNFIALHDCAEQRNRFHSSAHSTMTQSVGLRSEYHGYPIESPRLSTAPVVHVKGDCVQETKGFGLEIKCLIKRASANI